MQIFSKLQRNSAYYLFIKIFFWFFIAVLNSKILFFPLLLGVVVFCENFFVAVLYLSFFCIMHLISFKGCLFVFMIYIIYKFLLYKRLEDYLNPIYKPIVSVMIIYIGLMPVFGFNELILIYLLYNMAFDIVLIRIIKCEPISL